MLKSKTMKFPTSLIELHQWANTALLGIAVFFVVETYKTIKADHEKLANHETRITVVEKICLSEKTTRSNYSSPHHRNGLAGTD